jgi:hypothetical protein
MDFVASRADGKKHGWRSRVSQFLKTFGVTVFDPWFKPGVRGLHEYGREDEISAQAREIWDFSPGHKGVRARAFCAGKFWQTLHIDLRMVDTSDFTIAYCPTNVYSAGTPHEIVLCRQQRKPVLFVSPPVVFPALAGLRGRLESSGDKQGLLGVVETLLEHKCDKNARDKQGWTALHYAIAGGQKPRRRQRPDSGGRPPAPPGDGSRALG